MPYQPPGTYYSEGYGPYGGSASVAPGREETGQQSPDNDDIPWAWILLGGLALFLVLTKKMGEPVKAEGAELVPKPIPELPRR